MAIANLSGSTLFGMAITLAVLGVIILIVGLFSKTYTGPKRFGGLFIFPSEMVPIGKDTKRIGSIIIGLILICAGLVCMLWVVYQQQLLLIIAV
ncbi:MAG: hypothetical protein FWG55_06315 [Candidatus Bathyarchaeota archaeon]|nr:hypothetical protein [Candidatus Termiticorpusculum sp.]